MPCFLIPPELYLMCGYFLLNNNKVRRQREKNYGKYDRISQLSGYNYLNKSNHHHNSNNIYACNYFEYLCTYNEGE